MKTLLSTSKLLLVSLLALGGCSSITPIAKYTHISHASQHFGANKTNYGADMVGLGVKVKPVPKVTLEAVESYSFQSLHGRHEVFTGSITLEVR